MKKIYWMLMVAVLLVALLVPAGAINAGSGQIEVQGSFTLTTVGMANLQFFGQDQVITVEFTQNILYSGSFDGGATEVMDAMKNFKSGAFNSKGIQEFDGDFLGTPGTFTALVRHEGGMDDVAKIEMTIKSGEGSCENLHGTLIFVAYPHYSGGMISYYDGDYSGTLHFAP